jgi:hypothetical protein
MTEVPKIVYHCLDAASERLTAKATHPGADLLSAFAEQALSVAERENVLAHLAICGNCREVIALALPTEVVAPEPTTVGNENGRRASTPAKAGKGWLTSSRFVWPGLRWAAVAAGVAVAASVLLMHPGKLNQPTLLSKKQPAADTASPASIAPSPSSPMTYAPVLTKTEEKTAMPDSQSLKRLRPTQMAKQAREVDSPMLLAENKKQSNDSSDALAGLATGAKISNMPTVTNETVEVSAASPLEITEEASSDFPLTARDMAPAIEKAKPAPQSVAGPATVQAEAAPAGASAQLQAQVVNRNMMTLRQSLAPHVTWSISAGVLQESKDNGHSWQTALHTDHPLLTYASHGDDVWAGGEAGALYHSIDGGATWAQMQPSTESQRLTSGITHIGISGPTAIVFSTTNDEVWSTMDGGKTWAKK